MYVYILSFYKDHLEEMVETVYQVYLVLQELLGEMAVMEREETRETTDFLERKENPEEILEELCTSGGEGQSVLM
jgi:hypothetical protein